MEFVNIPKNLEQVRQDIQIACQRSGRDQGSVTLVAVSKHQPLQSIQTAYESGQGEFGENYAQELREKTGALLEAKSIRWHFIGPLQRNKVRWVVGAASLIHSVDRLSVLEAIADQVQKQNAPPQDCLVEVNIGYESQKSGCNENELAQLLDGFAAFAGKVRCLGLMCIPPATSNAEASRRAFRALHHLLKEMQKSARSFVSLRELSMGMSQDFSVAIEEGATIIRVGTGIFGPRPAIQKK